ncbi:MAG: hypothetical protein BWY76_00421 [bacterium ADurb.Bin429]|nr:MAG: hypothetical protein BWY76_00421 [bacterium ADurb.Bin429]
MLCALHLTIPSSANSLAQGNALGAGPDRTLSPCKGTIPWDSPPFPPPRIPTNTNIRLTKEQKCATLPSVP